MLNTDDVCCSDIVWREQNGQKVTFTDYVIVLLTIQEMMVYTDIVCCSDIVWKEQNGQKVTFTDCVIVLLNIQEMTDIVGVHGQPMLQLHRLEIVKWLYSYIYGMCYCSVKYK